MCAVNIDSIESHMGKITFRADDDLVDRLEAFDASKSEVLREALRTYLDEREDSPTGRSESDAEGSVDDVIRKRVDERVDERIEELLGPTGGYGSPADVSVTIALDGLQGRVSDAAVERGRSPTGSGTTDVVRTTTESGSEEPEREPQNDSSRNTSDGRMECRQCGEGLENGHVYCPNCGEKASRRLFCECGDEVRSDWSFCPGCGRRTPAADVLDSP